MRNGGTWRLDEKHEQPDKRSFKATEIDSQNVLEKRRWEEARRPEMVLESSGVALSSEVLTIQAIVPQRWEGRPPTMPQIRSSLCRI